MNHLKFQTYNIIARCFLAKLRLPPPKVSSPPTPFPPTEMPYSFQGIGALCARSSAIQSPLVCCLQKFYLASGPGVVTETYTYQGQKPKQATHSLVTRGRSKP